ncbi:hypothetical protein [Microbacterium deminutum]
MIKYTLDAKPEDSGPALGSGVTSEGTQRADWVFAVQPMAGVKNPTKVTADVTATFDSDVLYRYPPDRSSCRQRTEHVKGGKWVITSGLGVLTSDGSRPRALTMVATPAGLYSQNPKMTGTESDPCAGLAPYSWDGETDMPSLFFDVLVPPGESYIAGTSNYIPESQPVDGLRRYVRTNDLQWDTIGGDFHGFEYVLQASPCSSPLPTVNNRKSMAAALSSSVNSVVNSSPRLQRAINDLKGKYNPTYLTGAWPAGPNSNGYTSRESSGIRVALAWSKLSNRFDAAQVFAHELAHVSQILNRGFSPAEAAAVMTSAQYANFRWAAEIEAFEFQANVLAEIDERAPWLRGCVEQIYNKDPILRPETTGDELKADISERYGGDQYRDEWERDHGTKVSKETADKISEYLKTH